MLFILLDMLAQQCCITERILRDLWNGSCVTSLQLLRAFAHCPCELPPLLVFSQHDSHYRFTFLRHPICNQLYIKRNAIFFVVTAIRKALDEISRLEEKIKN